MNFQILEGAGFRETAVYLPITAWVFDEGAGGTRLEFTEAGGTVELPIPIPRLDGMDDLEVVRASFQIRGENTERSASSGGPSGSAEAVTLALPGASSPVSGALVRLEVKGLGFSAPDGNNKVILEDDDGRQQVWNGEGADPTLYVHAMLRAAGTGVSPPSVAAPSFAMPGGSDLYGPALGGARIAISAVSGSSVDLTITLDPGLREGKVQLFFRGVAGGAHAGLPTDAQRLGWTATGMSAVWRVVPAVVQVQAVIPDDPKPPVVASFPGEVAPKDVSVDFAPAARTLLRKRLSAAGADLGLILRFLNQGDDGKPGFPGALRVAPGSVSARYLRRPLSSTEGGLELKGAPEPLVLPLPEGLRPLAMSFTLDGAYGPAMLVEAADADAPTDRRKGFRVAGSQRLARYLTLTEAERPHRLLRVSLFGRALEAGELLLTLHGGDPGALGAPRAEPLSLTLAPAPQPGWLRAEIPLAGGLGPHPAGIWVCASVSRGAFWWHAAMETEAASLRSEDGGATWSRAAGDPAVQLHAERLSPTTGQPDPLPPLGIAWDQGVLSADATGSATATFRLAWLADGSGDSAAFLSALAGLGDTLTLRFACRRDVALRVLDPVLTYDPWTAKEP